MLPPFGLPSLRFGGMCSFPTEVSFSRVGCRPCVTSSLSLAPQFVVIVVDQLVTFMVTDCSAVISWIFSDTMQAHFFQFVYSLHCHTCRPCTRRFPVSIRRRPPKASPQPPSLAGATPGRFSETPSTRPCCDEGRWKRILLTPWMPFDVCGFFPSTSDATCSFIVL